MRLATSLSTLFLVSALVAGCGGDSDDSDGDAAKLTDMTTAEILEAVTEAQSKIDSLHVNGAGSGDDADTVIEMAINSADDCEGTMGLGGVSLDVISVDGTIYLRGQEFFAQNAGPEAAALIGDRWVSDDPENTDGLCEFDDLDVQGVPEGFAVEAKGEVTEIAGTEVIQLDVTDNENGSYQVWASVADHHVVRIEGEEVGTLTFTEINEPVEPTAPDAAEVIPASELD